MSRLRTHTPGNRGRWIVVRFIGFAFDSSVLIKMLGIGMAVAIVLDATVVRLILVPATMTLLGRWNWWMPRWLDKVLPDVPHEHSSFLPESQLEPADSADLVTR